mgnify:CR=1 FL=1
MYTPLPATSSASCSSRNALTVCRAFSFHQIAMRTRFQETTDTIYALKLLSDICCGAKVVYNDNGIATTVTTQKGVALQLFLQERLDSLPRLQFPHPAVGLGESDTPLVDPDEEDALRLLHLLEGAVGL